ncbi:MAG: SDR family NAD(P)-dependent oxidoreductase, partial [Alphaproteobacteria bacterium]
MIKGKTALVTGSTSGIGKAIADRLAGTGCDVVLNGFGDADEIKVLQVEMEQEHGVRVGYSGADLTKPEAIEAMMAYVTAEFGGADILVNNAGTQFVPPLEDFPVAKWDLIMALNLSAAFHTTRLAIGPMKAKGWGRIINTGSAHAKVASPFKSAYVAAKHGLSG